MPQLKQCLHWILRKMLQSIESKKMTTLSEKRLTRKVWKNWACIHFQRKMGEVDQHYNNPETSKKASDLSFSYFLKVHREKCFHLQSIGLELNIRKKLFKFKWNKILEHIINGDYKNLIREIYNNKLEVFWYDTVQLYLTLSHTWSGWLHDLKVSCIQLFSDSVIMHSKNIPIL